MNERRTERLSVPELLRSAAVFLNDRVAGAVGPDTALAFRVRVVSHLLEAAAAEVEEGPTIEEERRESLAHLLSAQGNLQTLETVLAHQMREDLDQTPDEEAALRGFLLNALRAELRLVAPRFDTRLHPEAPHT